MRRRTLIKALAALPVFQGATWEAFARQQDTSQHWAAIEDIRCSVKINGITWVGHAEGSMCVTPRGEYWVDPTLPKNLQW